MSIKNNTTSLQEVLNIINTLPEAGGIELPELTNEGSASDMFSGKQLIDQEGNIVTGTFTIDDELTTQDDLINQIQATVDGLPEAGGVELPTLTNEGSASDMLSGKQLINQEGNVVTGNILTKTSSDLTTSGATVTIPSGYYASQATKSVATATQATPSISIDSAGKITATATQTAGYVTAGTKTGTKQLTTQAAKTVTPTTSNQTAVASGIYTTGAVTVKGDANLVAANIAEGKTIFGVTGTHAGIDSAAQETWVLTLMNGSVVEKAVYIV